MKNLLLLAGSLTFIFGLLERGLRLSGRGLYQLDEEGGHKDPTTSIGFTIRSQGLSAIGFNRLM